ncbi:DUF58 domain-containing protein [Kiritimatiellota bacterium B12222]|nr:DUF58 domain-containing protein [Kiritimatiellota bacterium B12222]
MIAPSSRLILFGIALLPLSVLPLIMPQGEIAMGIGYAMAFTVAALDFALSLNLPLNLKIKAPADVRQSKHQTGRFHLDAYLVDETKPLHLILGIALPAPLCQQETEQSLHLSSNQPQLRTTWTFTPIKRGAYPVADIWVKCFSPLGLWTRRSKLDNSILFKIYPDLRRDRSTLASLFSRRGQIGNHLQKQTGQGREYDQIREYMPGDSPLDIHWKATAKRNALVTRTYQIERTQEVYLAIDHSRLSCRLHPTGPDTPPEPILERYVNTANLLALAAMQSGDLFGVMTFSDRVNHFIRAGNSPGHLNTVQTSLFALEPQNVYPDYDEWTRQLRMHVRRRSMVILLTDLSDTTAFESLEPRIRTLARSHLVVLAMIPLPGVEPLFHGPHENQDPYRRLAGHLMWRDLQDFRQRLAAIHVPLLLSSSEHLALDVINQYLSVKKSQRL